MNDPLPSAIDQLGNPKVVLLQTRKRDGTWVDTPVNIAAKGGHIYFRTPGMASKNKRLMSALALAAVGGSPGRKRR